MAGDAPQLCDGFAIHLELNEMRFDRANTIHSVAQATMYYAGAQEIRNQNPVKKFVVRSGQTDVRSLAVSHDFRPFV